MERLHTIAEIHEKTGLPIASLYSWRRLQSKGENIGPPSRKVGGRVYYRLSDVERWIEKETFVNAHKSRRKLRKAN